VFLKATRKKVRGKTYTNHLLVESISTPNGPRHRTVCSLGSLEPAPRQCWLALAHKLQAALSGQQALLPDAAVDSVRQRIETQPPSDRRPEWVSVLPAQIEVNEAREAGSVYVGHQMWRRLHLDAILDKAGLNERARLLTEVMTINRLVSPCSEHAMPDWVRRTALADLLEADFSGLNDEALYRNLDRLHPQRALIEGELAAREGELFALTESIYLYDLTSTYFEGQALANPKAKRGYSRDKRPDCKQVVVGLVLDGDGFPKAHEVFDGNRNDSTTVDEMLAALEKRVGKKAGATVTVDRGMAYAKNIEQIRNRGYHYLVAARPEERWEHELEFVEESGWEEIVREPSPTNPGQKKTQVWLKQCPAGEQVHVLCLSEQRKEKDRAIRELQEKRLLTDLESMSRGIAKRKKKPRTEAEVNQAIGRLHERYSRVGRYYQIRYEAERRALSWEADVELKRRAERLDGSYVLKTDRRDMSKEEVWRQYILLTRVEAAFRAMKSPLMERPIFHHLVHRVETHIFLCVLAYHLLATVEKTFLDQGIHTSWASLREQLATHQVVTVVMPTSDGQRISIRKATTPEPEHKRIYQVLRIPDHLLDPARSRPIVTERACK
jgi:transposase